MANAAAGKWGTLIAVSIAAFMLLLDVTVVNVALPDIQSDLDAGFNDLQSAADAVSLVYTPPAMRLSAPLPAACANVARTFCPAARGAMKSPCLSPIAPTTPLLRPPPPACWPQPRAWSRSAIRPSMRM